LQIRAVPGSQFRWRDNELHLGCSGLILFATFAYIVTGIAVTAAWQFTGNAAWIEVFFKVPSALLQVLLAATQLWFTLAVCHEFSAGEPMLAAWRLIAASAFCDLAGTFDVQVLGAETILNPLTHMELWSKAMGASIVAAGKVLQGPLRFALLAAGLFSVLRLYRESGFLGRLRMTDWALVGAFAAYCGREAFDMMRFLPDHAPAWGMASLWPVDPLLCLLLAEALLLHRSVQRTGMGLIGRCWRTFSVGIFLVLMGDVLLWAKDYGHLPWPWSSLSWYVWAPAAAAFALAPAYQLEAIRGASSGSSGAPE
jgi:hypothetical protein